MYWELNAHEKAIQENLLALTIGQSCLAWMKYCNTSCFEKPLDSLAVRILAEIGEVLDDKSYCDAECFEQIDRIVTIFYKYGIYTDRHIEYE